MTCHETTTRHADTVSASQPGEDDPFGLDDIPGFLRRTPKPAVPSRAGRVK